MVISGMAIIGPLEGMDHSKEWAEKITRNIERDERINRELEALGWRVLRIWESEIKTDVKRCGDIVEYAYWDIIRNSLPDEEVIEEDV